MKRLIMLTLTAPFFLPSVASAAAIRDIRIAHMFSLLNEECSLGFNQDKVDIFASTFGKEEGNFSDEEIEKAKGIANDEVVRLRNNKKPERLCQFANIMSARMPVKWKTWIND